MSTYHNIYKEKIEEVYKKQRTDSLKTLFTISASYLSTVLSTFSWLNLPKHIPSMNPENALFYWGIMGAFMENGELQLYPIFPSGTLQANGLYDKYTAIKFNGETKELYYDDICICFNNRFKTPSVFIVEELAEKSSFALSSVEHSLERVMIPTILNCKDETQAKKLTDLYERAKNELPFRISIGEAFGKDGIDIISFFDNRQYDVLSQWDVYVRFRNLFYSVYGINNVEILKKERLTEAEGSGNDEIVRFTFLKDMYEQRINFINAIKEKFGIELELEINRDSTTVYQITASNKEKIDAIKLDVLRGVNLPQENVEKNEEEENENDDSSDFGLLGKPFGSVGGDYPTARG